MACALLFARWLFPTSSPLNWSVLSCSRREKNTHTAELIFVVYREYAGFAGSKKTALTCMTGDKCVLNFSVKVPPTQQRASYNMAKITD